MPNSCSLSHRPAPLRITAFATGSAASSAVLAEYELANEAAANQDVTLALAVRPFQVNPPAQFLNSPGGTSQIRSIAWDDGAFAVNGQRVRGNNFLLDGTENNDIPFTGVAQAFNIADAVEEVSSTRHERPKSVTGPSHSKCSWRDG